jgi:hypothetical protein
MFLGIIVLEFRARWNTKSVKNQMKTWKVVSYEESGSGSEECALGKPTALNAVLST